MEKLLNGAEVEWKPLGEVCHSIKTGLNPRQFFTLNTPDATNYYVTIRELQNHKIIFTDKTDKLNDEALKLCNNRSNLEIGDILFSGTGTIGNVALIDKEPRNWNIKEGVYAIKPKKNIILPKFLLYLFEIDFIRKDFLSKSAGGTVKSVPMKELAKIIIPIPPLSTQEKIVKTLDKFTELEATLEAELALRKKQYQYYRETLLTFPQDLDRGGYNDITKALYHSGQVVFKALGEVGELIRGNGLQKKDFTESGVPAIHYGQIYTYYSTFADKTKSFVSVELAKKLKKARKGDVLIAGTSENIEDVMKPLGWLGDEIVFSGDMFAFRPNNDLETKYLTYLLQTERFAKYKEKYAQGTKVIRLNSNNFLKYEIPVPSLTEQQKIVKILDKFDRLTNSISEGLPKEIALRRKQYEYYREQLLDFPK
ncbi:restriction endonuclease subunit S [Mannheimia granulomatis]|nr:restriction endonuclease subunit S [Mannheimia granulomatis]